MTHLFPQLLLADPDLFPTAAAILEQSGCIARRRGVRTLEVWEANLSEHYLLTLDRQQPPRMDIIQLDGL
ncbi:MAG: hypothetical protein ABI700_01930 [Chloroflexota bacterium]